MADAALWGIGGMAARGADPERALVERLAEGDRDALDQICAAHGRALASYLHQLCGDPDLCEEVLQDTLVAAWQGAAHFRGASALRTWLIGIARRQMLAALRRRRVPLRESDGLAGVADSARGPEAAALAQAERAEIAVAMRRLSPLHREVLRLAFIEDLSYAELAQVLRVPLGTVKSRLSNAKRALRRLLEPREAHRP